MDLSIPLMCCVHTLYRRISCKGYHYVSVQVFCVWRLLFGFSADRLSWLYSVSEQVRLVFL